MKNQPFTIKVRYGNKEIELSGSREDVLEALENFPKIMERITSSFKAASSRTLEDAVAESLEEFSPVSIGPDTPCPEAIVKLLSTSWGRAKPRRLREILEAMKVNAIHYPVGTVKGRLTDLTKKGVLRRVKEGREYGYILVKKP